LNNNYNTEACRFDGGDCDLFNSFPNCNVTYPSWIGNEICNDNPPYNTKECGFDGLDCSYPDCNVDRPDYIGDGECNGGDYNTEECGFDGGDCDEFNNLYPRCTTVDRPGLIKDGNCNGGDYNTEECKFDGGDCDLFNSYPKCNVTYPSRIGDGKCDNYSPYNTEECGFDGLDCSPSAAPSLSPSPSAAPSLSPSTAPTRTLWVNPNDSEFSPLFTYDGTVLETITLGDDAIAIVNIGFDYNWFGNNLTQLVIQSNGQLFMDTSNTDTDNNVHPIGR
jgi:hypothetical protein